MPDSYFSSEKNQNDKKFSTQSALTAVVEIMDYEYFMESDKFHELQSFYNELACELHTFQRQNYRRGFGAIKPDFRIMSDRIYVYSFLYLEENVPELSSMIFNIFVEACNMLLAVALKHEMVVRGIAGIDALFNTYVDSGSGSRLEKEDTLMLADMLKVFTFEEIFPEGLDQVFIPAVAIPVLHSHNFLHANHLLKEINAVGIYLPDTIRSYPAAELAIYSDLLIETSMEGEKVFAANWFNWADKHPENFPVEEVQQSIARLALCSESKYAGYWKKFNELSPGLKDHLLINPDKGSIPG